MTQFKVLELCLKYPEVVDLLNEQEELIKRLKQIRDEQIETILKLKRKIQELEKEIRTLKITYAKCRDCQHANMYTPEFAFLVIDPKCELDVKPINSDTNACEDFELIGRCSR